MIEQIETLYPAEILCRFTVTKPAKRLPGIAAARYELIENNSLHQSLLP